MGNQEIVSKPTSFIPTTAKLETVRPTKALLEGMHIEAVHVLMFFGILAFLFLGIWKTNTSSKK
jgi:hypothetical protein